MSTVTAKTRESSREAAGNAAAPALLPDTVLVPQAGRYSLIQLEALAGIALKQATRKLRLSSTAG